MDRFRPDALLPLTAVAFEILLALAAVGVAAGVTIAAGITPLMGSQVFGVPPLDPVTYAVVPLLLVGVATIAALVPGRRAMRIDPARAMNAN